MTEPRPLAVFSAVAYCDTKYEHEHRMISTGTRAYAYHTAYEARDAEAVLREGTRLSTPCLADTPSEERCHGMVEWHLDEDGTWTSDADACRLLAEYGADVEVDQ